MSLNILCSLKDEIRNKTETYQIKTVINRYLQEETSGDRNGTKCFLSVFLTMGRCSVHVTAATVLSEPIKNMCSRPAFICLCLFIPSPFKIGEKTRDFCFYAILDVEFWGYSLPILSRFEYLISNFHLFSGSSPSSFISCGHSPSWWDRFKMTAQFTQPQPSFCPQSLLLADIFIAARERGGSGCSLFSDEVPGPIRTLQELASGWRPG